VIDRKYMSTLLLASAGVAVGVWLFGAFGLDGTAVASPKDQKTEEKQSKAPDWCAEHRVPESECTLCHPELVEKFKAEGNWCGEHHAPETHCRQCHPTLTFQQEPGEPVTAEPVQVSVFFPPNQKGCATEQAIIRFASEKTADRIGLKVEPTFSVSGALTIDAPAEIVFDDTKLTAVSLAVPATVIRWFVEPGQTVTSGQRLAELQSPSVADMKAEYLKARGEQTVELEQFKRVTELREHQMISAAELEQAENRLKAALSHFRGAEGKLISLGLSSSDLESLTASQNADARWNLGSPCGGTILERRASLGEQRPEGATLAFVGDPSALWIQASIREQDLPGFHAGQKVEFSADGGSLTRAEGKVIWVSQYLESTARTGIVRAKVTSDPSRLTAHLFGRVSPSEQADAHRLMVSKEAVQFEGCCHIVFVQEAIDRYRPIKVTIARGDDRHYLVTSGLKESDLVVTTGSFLLKTELKKESLGAGCAD
jgi:cobalt-zinc-cadmium efflux system membrane fusion protein